MMNYRKEYKKETGYGICDGAALINHLDLPSWDYVKHLEKKLEAVNAEKTCKGCKYVSRNDTPSLNECNNCIRKGTDNYLKRE